MNNLLSGLQQHYYNLLSQGQHALSNVGQAVGNEVHQLPQQINNVEQAGVRAIGNSPVGHIITGQQQLPQVNLSSYATHIQNPVLKFGAQAGLSTLDTALNLPRNAVQIPINIARDVNSGDTNIKHYLGDAAPLAESMFTVGTLGGGSVVKSLGEQALKGAAKQTAKQAIKSGLKTGAAYGGAYGLLSGLDSGRNIQDNGDYAKNLGINTGLGAAGGALLGGGTGVAGHALGAARNAVVSATQKLFPSKAPQEVQQLADKYIRDELGQFATGGSSKPNAPKWYGDLNESLGLPRHADPQSGKINFSAPIGGLGGKKGIISPKNISSTGDVPSISSPMLPKDQGLLPNKLQTQSELGSKGAYLQQNSLLQKTQKSPEAMKLAEQQSTSNISSNNPISQTQQYINEQLGKQSNARGTDNGGFLQKGMNFLADAKAKLVDSTAPIEDVLSASQKKGKFEVLPTKDISPQIDRAIRSQELAGQFAKDNGLVDVIKKTPDINALNQYLIAKHAPEVAAQGFKTGRDAIKDTQLVKDLAPTYEPYAQQVTQYGQRLLDYATQTGLVSKETAQMLKQKYPNYVPLNRIFNELEKTSVPEGVGRGVASLSKQTLVKRLQGSERAIQNPIESLLSKTADAISQGERNQAGKMLASYKDLPIFNGLIKEVPKGENNPVHSFSYLDNGVKKTYETTPEIASAAKFLDKRQLGFIGNILATPVRIARVGITGVNVPFVATNLLKDQVSAIINSKNALKTSVANPTVFLKAAWSAIGHGKEYENWIRNAGGGTSFDISRSEPHSSVAQIRAGRNVGSKIAYTATHPGELLRAIENIVNRGEELTRNQQFIGTRDILLKQGRTPEDANILAAQASRRNTTDFSRSGDWGKALNSVFLYLNAGIQGGRTLVRNLQTRPAQTSAKLALTVFTPVAAVTAWNLSDPQRKAAYDDIQDFEKDNNLVIIPPNPTRDANGKWNVIKIPFSQEIANLTTPVRKGIESLQGYDAPGFGDFASAILGSTTGLNLQSPNALVGQFVPQAVKPPLESLLNKNLFTGGDIVPQYLNGQLSKTLPPEMQVRPNTSGTAREIGGALNTSPLKVEEFIKSTAGGVGSQLLNASDQVQAKAGMIPSNEVGGQSIVQGLQGRVMQATGGKQLSNLFNNAQPKGATGNSTQSSTSENTNVVENNGKFYVNLGNGNVKAFDTKAQAQDGLLKEQVKTTGNAAQLSNGDIAYKSTTGKVESLSLKPPTKGTGIGSFANTNWNAQKAADIWNNESIPQDLKNQALKQLSIAPEDARYAALAKYGSDVSTQYLVSKSPDHQTLINNILTGRVVSNTGSQFASNDVISKLYDQGLLSKGEAAQLKKIKTDKQGNSLSQGGTGRVKKVRAIKIPKIKAPKMVKISQPKRIKQVSLKVPKLSTKVTKVKKLSLS